MKAKFAMWNLCKEIKIFTHTKPLKIIFKFFFGSDIGAREFELGNLLQLGYS